MRPISLTKWMTIGSEDVAGLKLALQELANMRMLLHVMQFVSASKIHSSLAIKIWAGICRMIWIAAGPEFDSAVLFQNKSIAWRSWASTTLGPSCWSGSNLRSDRSCCCSDLFAVGIGFRSNNTSGIRTTSTVYKWCRREKQHCSLGSVNPFDCM